MGNYRSGNKNALDNLGGKKKGGRPKGSKGKIYIDTKFNMRKAVNTVDGNEYKFFMKWLKEDPGSYRSAYAKAMIPKETQVQGDVNVNFSWIKDDTADNGPL